jgi:hypothetical protein
MNSYDVVIATPGETFNQYYLWSLIDTIEYLNDNGISWRWANDYSSHVGEARQRLIDKLNTISYKKLFWIDSDISWQVKDFDKLLNSGRPMVSGCYITTAGVVAAQDTNGHSIPIDELESMSELHDIQSCGFGFLCIDEGIIEKIKDPMMPIDGHLNEDVSFCIRVKKQLGIQILLDTKVRVDHFRTVSLGWGEV